MKYDSLGPEYCRILREAGWFDGRHADLRAPLELLSQEQLPSFPTAEDFLGDFHGLMIPWECGFQIDVALVLREFGADGVRGMSQTLNRTLCPVGWGSSAALLISESDEFVIIEDQWIEFSVFPSRADFLLCMMGRKDIRSSNFLIDEATGAASPDP